METVLGVVALVGVLLFSLKTGRRGWIVPYVGCASYAAWVSWSSTSLLERGTVLVTGASSGIGRNATFYLAERGFYVLATYRKAECSWSWGGWGDARMH
jgi:hypothetical protein